MTNKYSKIAGSMVVLFGLRLITIQFVFGQDNTLDQAAKDDFLEVIISSLEEEYVLENKGRSIAQKIRMEIQNGNYNNQDDIKIFVEKLNRDLYRFSNDLHLLVDVYESNPKSSRSTQSKTPLFKSEVLPGGVSYLKFDHFPMLNKGIIKETDSILKTLSNEKMMIIDLRDNSGGSDEYVNHLLGYFFSEKVLLATSYRVNEPPVELYSHPKAHLINLTKIPIYILTSKATFSAAEIFTYRLQQFGRATVVGHKTPGAAHRTMTYLIDDLFLLQWPYERSIHSVENMDIEGIGVVPDISSHYNQSINTAILHYSQFNTQTIYSEGSNNIWAARMNGVINQPQNNGRIEETIVAIKQTINSKNKPISEFLDQHVNHDSQKNVKALLNTFKTVWGHVEIDDIYYLNDKRGARLFFNTKYGPRQMKFGLNELGKIEELKYR